MEDKIISHISFVNNDKKYKLHELKNKITLGDIYEIELFTTEWTYDKISKIIHTFLIPDLISIVFEYSLDVQNLSVILGLHSEQPEIYFFTDTFVYNFFVKYSLKYITLQCTSCPIMYKRVKTNRYSKFPVSCQCDDVLDHETFVAWWHNDLICKDDPFSFLPANEMNIVYLMYTIFKLFL